MTASRWRWLRAHPWVFIALGLVLSLDFILGSIWIVQNPQASSWDEAGYVNQINSDAFTFHSVGKFTFVKAFVQVDATRPSAYRLLVAPLDILFNQLPVTLLRFIALGAFGV